MTNFKNFIQNLLADEEGATAIEYALIVALVAIVLIAALGLIGDELTAIFGRISDALGAA